MKLPALPSPDSLETVTSAREQIAENLRAIAAWAEQSANELRPRTDDVGCALLDEFEDGAAAIRAFAERVALG